MSEKVSLLVYDLTQGMARTMIGPMLGLQIQAIYHSSLLVYGKEHYFGGGICRQEPMQTPYGKPIKEIVLGMTQIPKEVFYEYLQEISSQFSAQKYNLIDHNCNHFTNAAAEFLTGTGIPKEIVDQGKILLQTPMGKQFEPLLRSMQGSIQNPPSGMYR